MTPKDSEIFLQAVCVLVEESGFLILGEPGAGKSTLARHLVGLYKSQGIFSTFLADDAVYVKRVNDALLARPPQEIRGRHEIRGVGVVACEFAEKTVLAGIIRIENAPPERLPPEAAFSETLMDVRLPKITVSYAIPFHISLSLIEYFLNCVIRGSSAWPPRCGNGIEEIASQR